MNAEIIAVGSELLLGQIANTNAQFISRHLAEVGVNVYFHTVVGDNPDRLKEAVRLAEQRADLLIFTGGLGPTKDDLTKEVLASCAGKELVYDQAALESIKSYFLKTNRVMTENNKKQALIIKDSVVLANNHGMAPGMFLKSEHAYYMLLPGPPKEMQPMFVEYGKPLLLQIQDKVERIESRVLRFFGIGESVLETKIEDLLQNQSNPTIAPLAGDGEVTLRVTAKHESEQEAYRLIKKTEEEILQRVGQFFYGYDQTTIIAEVAGLLMQHNKTIAAAESLTGGLFQSELTSVPDASSIYKGGLVCYSNESKEQFVRVRKQTIEKFGAVSEECAMELAENIRELFDTDFGISFTGVAGPNELEGKMPGTVWVGLAEKDKQTKAYLLELAGSRSGIRKRSVQYGCHYLLNEMKSRKIEMF